ncbi:MAG: PorT family protein [Cyclobacteriaceae bacterium]|nr:PorT family protein [Cyclobacteriaceae bacterium]
MKKLFCLLFIAISFQSIGQFSIGAKIGSNINYIGSSVSGGNVYRTNIGFHAGIFVQLPIKDKFSLIPEVQYIQKGADVAFSNGFSSSTERINLNYIELPILLSYSPIKQINIDLGPNFALMTSSKATGVFSNANLDNVYSKFDFNISGGMRWNVASKVSVIGRYNYGLSKIEENNNVVVNGKTTKATYSNRTIQFGLSYQIAK